MADGSQTIVVGKFVGVFGVKGWLKVKSFTAPEDNILEYKPWFIKVGSGQQAFEVDAFQQRPQGLVVHLKGVDDRDLASSLRGEIRVQQSLLPQLAEDDFYWYQLKGLSVISTFGGKEQNLGKVKDLMETGANDVLVVVGDDSSIDQQERLVPYVWQQYVQRVDLEAKQIWVDWDPEF